MGLTAFAMGVIGIVVLAALWLFFKYGKDRVPAPVVESIRAVANDVTALLKAELERRYEVAKTTPTPFDDHFYGALRDFNETIRLLIAAPAIAPAPTLPVEPDGSRG